ncbi:hypothetical protein CDIK_3785 [Cucumispora dikerogammari]|nr:hypothetical protein CDIK_3785 [Cucumispora dikerogammari]
MSNDDLDSTLFTSEIDLLNDKKIINKKIKSKRIKEQEKKNYINDWETENLQKIIQKPFIQDDVLPLSFFSGNQAWEMFNYYFSKDIVIYILRLTNKKISSRRSTFSLVTETELRAYFGIIICMGLKKVSNYKSYWTASSRLLFCKIFSKAMSLKRFSEINSNLTCISKSDYVEGRKIVNKPKILNRINKKFARPIHPVNVYR